VAWLLDTCVLSELAKPRPDAGVVRWLEEADETRLYLSVVTLGELEKGIARLPASARRARIERWVREELAARFEGRLIDVERKVAERWGAISGASEARGVPLPVIDALIAASALTHGLEVVTRNTVDLERCGARCVNPWQGAAG
jgi:predicted nucleic acid-binding protein